MDAEAVVTGSRDIPDGETIRQLIALGFSEETLIALDPAIAATKLVHHAAGDTVFREATDIDALYVIRKGRIKLLNYMENGRARIVRVHNRSSIVGINGLMGEVHQHTAVAIDDVTLYQIPMPLLKSIRDSDPDTYSSLLEYWHEYLNMADRWIMDFSTGAIPGRVARLVKFLVDTDDNTGPYEVTLLTVDEMAEILGVTPESVSRSMASLKRKKILQLIDDEMPDHYRCNINQLLREAEN